MWRYDGTTRLMIGWTALCLAAIVRLGELGGFWVVAIACAVVMSVLGVVLWFRVYDKLPPDPPMETQQRPRSPRRITEQSTATPDDSAR